MYHSIQTLSHVQLFGHDDYLTMDWSDTKIQTTLAILSHVTNGELRRTMNSEVHNQETLAKSKA